MLHLSASYSHKIYFTKGSSWSRMKYSKGLPWLSHQNLSLFLLFFRCVLWEELLTNAGTEQECKMCYRHFVDLRPGNYLFGKAFYFRKRYCKNNKKQTNYSLFFQCIPCGFSSKYSYPLLLVRKTALLFTLTIEKLINLE